MLIRHHVQKFLCSKIIEQSHRSVEVDKWDWKYFDYIRDM